MQLYVQCLVINTTVSAVSVKVKEIFSFQQGVTGETARLIADSCQHLTKLRLDCWRAIGDDDVIHVIKNWKAVDNSGLVWRRSHRCCVFIP